MLLVEVVAHPLHAWIISSPLSLGPLTQESIVKALLEAGADVNARQSTGHTPLHCCAMEGQQGMMRDMLAAGANASLASVEGQTALHTAAQVLPKAFFSRTVLQLPSHALIYERNSVPIRPSRNLIPQSTSCCGMFAGAQPTPRKASVCKPLAVVTQFPLRALIPCFTMCAVWRHL